MANAYEDKNVVYKREYTDKIKRTVVAFANANGGKIYVGIDDFGQVVGVDDVDDVKRRLSKLIQDGIFPDVASCVEYTVEYAEGKKIVGVEVSRGARRPYWLVEKGLTPEGALVRRDAASSPASVKEIERMIEETSGGSYERARTLAQNLSFLQATDVFLKRGLKLDRLELRELGFVDDAGAYANLAMLLSDQCPMTIKIAILADDGNVGGVVEFSGSLFKQFDDARAELDRRNRKFAGSFADRRVDGREYRVFPDVAIREALANAVVHRDYASPVPTLVRVSTEKIEFVSPGGLVQGVSKEELSLGVSICRNPKLARVFHKIQEVDSFGLGLARIRRAYEGTSAEPKFEVGANFFKATLPKTPERRAVEADFKERPVEVRVAKRSPIRVSVSPTSVDLDGRAASNAKPEETKSVSSDAFRSRRE